jgi:diguanylate cyclase (GGDEF)-like protein/PAS domain S-box-containing protein
MQKRAFSFPNLLAALVRSMRIRLPAARHRLALNSLRVRLLLLVLLATIPSTLMSVYSGWMDRVNAINSAKESLQRLAELAAATEARSLENARKLLSDLAKSQEVLNDTPDCFEFFASVLRRNQDFINIGLIRPNGDVSCSAVPSLKPVNLADRSHFKRAVEERRFVTGKYVFGRVIQQHTVNLTYPIESTGGTLVGVLFAALDLGALERFMYSVDMPDKALLVTTDMDGQILVARPEQPQWIGESVGATLFDHPNQLKLGTATIIGKDGVKRLYASAPVGSSDISNFTVTIGFPFADIVGPAEKNQAMRLMTAFLTTLVALFAAWFISDVIIVRRVKVLVRTAKAIAAGQLGARTGLQYGREEISTLAHAVDNMAASLQTHEAERDMGRKLLFAEKELAQVTLRSIGDAVMTTDWSGLIDYMNPVAERLTGWSAEEVRGKPCGLVFNVLAGRPFVPDMDPISRALTKGTVIHLGDACTLFSRDQNRYAIEGSVAPIRDDHAQIVGAVLVFRDVSEAKALSKQLSYQASHDGLTGLCNRQEFERRLNELIRQEALPQRHHAVLYLDLDRFKQVNDSLGHDKGDLLLEEIARRLEQAVRSGDVTARLGGDEFVTLLQDISNDEAACLIAENILTAVCAPIQLGGHEISVSTSIGGSVYPRDGTDVSTLLKNADLAMYQAKELKSGSFRFFDPQMNTRMLERLIMEHALRNAVERNEFVLHYQPRVSIQSGCIVGVEALVRWNHPEKGLIGPMEFIPLAEEVGLINPIGEWVLNAACRQYSAWQAAGLKPFTMAVNMSAQQLDLSSLQQTVRSVLQKYGVDANRLEIEITESSLMQNLEATSETLGAIRATGVSISIDDFGTGYSSLAHIKRLPIDTLKIDKSFIFGILTDPDDATIVRAMVALAHQMELKVVAEGVTESGQLAFLKACGCDDMQGYLFSRPLPADGFEVLMRNSSSERQ